MLGVFMSDFPEGFVTAGHAVLFQDPEAHRCDVCAERLRAADAQTSDGSDSGDADDPTSSTQFAVEGRGLLVWSRGEERRYQEPLLCATCAVAIGVSALQRYEIEEEEG